VSFGTQPEGGGDRVILGGRVKKTRKADSSEKACSISCTEKWKGELVEERYQTNNGTNEDFTSNRGSICEKEKKRRLLHEIEKKSPTRTEKGRAGDGIFRLETNRKRELVVR